jgi:hypothetical protein
MSTAKSVGRLVGVLALMHLGVGLMVPFIMLDRVKRATGLVASASANAGQVRASVLLLFVGSAIAIAITAVAFTIIGRYSTAIGVWLVALAVAGFSLQAVDNAAILWALSVSREYAQADAANMPVFQTLALVVNAARKWTHYCSLLVMVSWIWLFNYALYRFQLAPRLLAGLGMVATAMQISGVTLLGFLGYPPETRLAVPLAPVYVALALWLMVKGFDESHRRLESPDIELVGS